MEDSSPQPFEMRVGSMILRLHSRVLEVFSSESNFNARWHVDTVGFAARDPDRHGQTDVRIGLLKDGELVGERVNLELDSAQWQRFQALVATVKREQAAGLSG